MATGYPDIGALQHKDAGGDAANTGYPDIGALQHQDAGGAFVSPPGNSNQFLMMLGVGT